jgi:hypothetical protein
MSDLLKNALDIDGHLTYDSIGLQRSPRRFFFMPGKNFRARETHPIKNPRFNNTGKEIRMANFLFILSKDEADNATRCFQLSKIAHSKGHKVNLFFIDDGVKWADSSRDLFLKSATGDCPNDYLPYLVEHEIPIGV